MWRRRAMAAATSASAYQHGESSGQNRHGGISENLCRRWQQHISVWRAGSTRLRRSVSAACNRGIKLVALAKINMASAIVAMKTIVMAAAWQHSSGVASM